MTASDADVEMCKKCHVPVVSCWEGVASSNAVHGMRRDGEAGVAVVGGRALLTWRCQTWAGDGRGFAREKWDTRH